MKAHIRVLVGNHARIMKAVGGFTLVEIALALLVVSIGMLAVVGLMAGGLDMSSDSVGDAQASMFAAMVFDGYRAEFERDKTAWEDADDLLLPSFGGGIWNETGAPPYDLAPIADNSAHTIKFEHADSGIEAYSLRYRLSFSNVTTKVKSATLEIWPREFGPTLAANAEVFYTEFYQHE